MGIFDIFTGAPAQRAAAQQRAHFDKTQQTGNTQLDNALMNSTNFVTAGTGGARDALGAGYDTATGAVRSGAASGQGYINQGVTGAQNAYGQAGAAFDPLSALASKYGGGTNLYLDSLGVGGAEGNARAQQAFQPSGAYNFNLDQGLEAIMRGANARGGGAGWGGNVDRDAQEYGAGLASKEYGGWQDRLAGLISPELAATSGAATGRAGLLGQEAGLLANAGQARAGLATAEGGKLSDLATGLGTGRAALESGQGNTLAELATRAAQSKVGLAGSLAQPYANTYGQEAQAQMAGSGNLWGLGLNLARLASGSAGGASGGLPTSAGFGGSNPFSFG